jgi:hypothetical protein
MQDELQSGPYSELTGHCVHLFPFSSACVRFCSEIISDERVPARMTAKPSQVRMSEIW